MKQYISEKRETNETKRKFEMKKGNNISLFSVYKSARIDHRSMNCICFMSQHINDAKDERKNELRV